MTVVKYPSKVLISRWILTPVHFSQKHVSGNPVNYSRYTCSYIIHIVLKDSNHQI